MTSTLTTPDNGPLDPFDEVPEYVRRLFRAEPLALAVRRWHELRIPGVLHCPEFTIAAHAAHSEDMPLPFTAEQAVAQREKRRAALLSCALERTHIVLYEEALHRVQYSLGRDVARSQFSFLAGVVDGSANWCDARTTLSILPRTSRLLFAPGDLTILTFPADADETNFVYHELEFGPAGGVDANYITEPDLLAKADRKWDRITNAGLLDKAGSLDLIDTLREALY